MPRAKYTKPSSGPLASEHIRRSTFRFRGDQWRQLVKLLPDKLASLSAPSEYVDAAARESRVPGWTLKTIADLIVQMTEEEISSHLTAYPLVAEGLNNRANVRAAIRALRTALMPFTHGWVDPDTAALIPARLDAALLSCVFGWSTIR